MASLKQKLALKNVVENGGNVSLAMRDAGYSPNTAKTPQKLTSSKAWEELMEEYLPDTLLAERHSALLNKKTENGEPDTVAVKAALEMAYKLKGAFVDRMDVTSEGKVLPAKIVFNFIPKP